MADQTMFDIAVASMKLGVAVPIYNPSFKYWDDPGTWADPSQWQNLSSYFTINRSAVSGVWYGYDDDAASTFVIASAPDDYSRLIYSGDGNGVRFWPSEMFDLGGSQDFYWSLVAQVTLTTGGGNRKFNLFLQLGTDAAMGTRTDHGVTEWTSNQIDLTLENGTLSSVSVTQTYDFARLRFAARDISGTASLTLDCIGMMFNPWDGSGFYLLDKVFPANGPLTRYDKFARLIKTPTQVAHQYDPSGGAEVIRLGMEFRQENQDFYENMLRFFRFNKGTPGVAGRPLALEPNIPGLPPMLVGNFLNPTFPLVRDTVRAERYSGTFEFETMW